MNSGQMGAFFNRAIDLLLPPRCLVTGRVVEGPGMLAPAAWAQLRFLADPLCGRCGYPFDFAAAPGTGEMLCAACLREEPPFGRARAALAYDDASRTLILKFKHGDQTHSVGTLIPWMERAGAALLADAEAIVPVPLHRWRLLRRRYNQAALLAQGLARRGGTAFLPDALLRVRATPTQGHLGFRARHSNVRGAFALNPRHAEKIRDRTILLVDDVYTSGATIRECAAILKRARAARVDILTLARVIKPGYGE